MENAVQQKSYNIRDNYDYYRAGYLRNGHQVLMGPQMPELVLVEFDTDGTYLRTATRHTDVTTNSDENLRFGTWYDEYLTEISRWQAEIGFVPHTITVKPFFLDERWIGIRDLPDHYQDVLDNPTIVTEERYKDIHRGVQAWLERGNFVLFWDEDYYLNSDGDVDSS